ncbi:MAG TPA: MgtC/SapB family protein [Kofleriaceae bacterium]|nr:MgtC/SapB family protein [Kofleriaceae bacterium]
MSNCCAGVLVLAVVSAATPGCVSQIHALPSHWDGSSEPACTQDDGLVVGDVVLSGLGFGAAAVVARSGDRSTTAATLGITAGLAAGLGFLASALVGHHEVRQCQRASAEWRIGRAIAENLPPPVEPIGAPAEPAPPPPRGFFCASSPAEPAAGLCSRERADCERARAASPTLATCALAEHAWCFATRCYPSAAACDAQRGPDAVGECHAQG